MVILQNETWLEFSELLSVGISEITVKMGIQRKSTKWQSIKDPSDGRKRLIRYATLAESYKVAVRADLCGGLEPEEWLTMQEEQKKQDEGLGKRAALIDKVRDMCEEDYRLKLHLYRGTEPRQQRCLSKAAGIIEILAAHYKANGISWKAYEPVNQVSAWVLDHMDHFPLKYLPTNPIRLKEKVLAFAVEGVELNEVIALPRLGNGNRATKQKETWWQETAIALRIDTKNYTQSQIVRMIRRMSPQLGKEAPSETTVRAFLAKKEHITVKAHTDLNNKRLQRHRSSLPLAPAMAAHACWEMDGTKVQFAGHLTGNKTKDGRKETKALYIVGVRDVYSGAWLGYWYGYGEDENAYRSALKMAVDITGRLPYELRYDQFPGSTSASWQYMEGTRDKSGKILTEGALEKAGVKLTKTSRSEGKAHVERAYLTLQQVFEAEKKEFIGLGIKAGIAHARPTELYVSRMQREFLNNGWNFEQAWMSHAGVIASYNHTVLSTYSRKHASVDQTPWQLMENGIDEENGHSGRAIEGFEAAELFWETRREGIRQGSIRFQIRKTWHTYYVNSKDYDMLEYQRQGVQVVVRFDPVDMSEIMVFNEKGDFLGALGKQELIPTFGPDADWESLSKFKEDQAQISKISKAKLSEYALSDEVAALLPTLAGKEVHNDALENYALKNSDRWKNTPKKKSAPAVSNLDDFDLDAYTRGQY